jgi:hypothetical protein
LPPLPKRPHPHAKPWPIVLTVKTVPALTGVRLAVDGHLITTDSHGFARFTQDHNLLPHTLTLLDHAVSGATLKYRFNRWDGQRDPNQAFTSTVTGLPMRSAYTITAAFTVQFPVTPHLVHEDGVGVDLSEVSAISVRSESGNLVDLNKDTTTWLDGTRPVFQQGVLSARAIPYTVQSVMVHGTNVVDAGRQSFQPSANQTPTFTTQFHDLTITAHDALFGSPLGKRAIVTLPDGTRIVRDLGPTHTTKVPNLPRGKYSVVVQAGVAVVAADVFNLSKSQTADIAVISSKDMSLLGLGLLLMALVLLGIGRHHRLRRAVAGLHRFRSTQGVSPALLDDVLI